MFKKLTPGEMQERRRQGLCFNYDEKFVRGHRCARLFYLETADFDDKDMVPTDDEEELGISLQALIVYV